MDYVDHYAGAKANLLQQYLGKPVMDALLKAMAQELNELDQTCLDLIDNRTLDTATGIQLDGWGIILNTARGGLSDSDYRSLLTVVLSGYGSSGTPEQLLYLVTSLMESAEPVEIVEEFPGAVLLNVINPVNVLPQSSIRTILKRSKPAGVNLNVIVIPPSPYFGFDEDTDPDAAGFDDGSWSDVF